MLADGATAMDAMNEFYGASEYALSAGSVLVLMFGMGATLERLNAYS